MAEQAITLQIVMDLLGAGKVSEAKQALENLKESTTDLSKQMGVVAVSGNEVEEMFAKTSDGAKISKLELRELARALGSEIPGGAALARSGMEIFSGGEAAATGGVLLLIAGIEMLKAAIEKLNAEKKESAQLSEALADADRATTKIIDAQREALEKATVAQAEFFHEYLRNTHDAVQAEAELYEARLRASFEQANTGDTTRRNIAGKAIDELEQRGVLSHAAAVKAKEQMDLEYEARKLARQQAEAIAIEGELARQQSNKEIALGVDTAAEGRAEKQYESAATARAANDARLEAAQGKIAAAHSVIGGLGAAGINEGSVEQLRDLYAKISGDASGSASLPEMFHAVATASLEGGGRMSLNGNIRAAGSLVAALGSQGDVNLGTYEGAQLDIKSAQLEANRARAKQAPLDVAEGSARSDVGFYRQRMEKDRDAAQDLGDKLQSTQAINRIKEAGARTDFGLDAAAHILEGHATNIGNFMEQVNRLADVLGRMSPTDITGLIRRIDQVEAQNINAYSSQISG